MSSKLRTAAFVISALMVPFAASAADTATSGTTTSTADSKPVRVVKDSAITTKVKAKLAEARAGFTKSVHVKTKGGVVTLTGTALSKDESDQAASIAKDTDGVSNVVNNIKITK